MSATEIVDLLLDAIVPDLPFQSGDEVPVDAPVEGDLERAVDDRGDQRRHVHEPAVRVTGGSARVRLMLWRGGKWIER